ncbi:MAG: hypothetical protein JRN53_01230 [Nitrososphaerota archaeon]|nr:hypothetical protein [Nitrososphaerota archaeon]MDG7046192.1 hypothetical protein [Nitrososphaerota archaeon]
MSGMDGARQLLSDRWFSCNVMKIDRAVTIIFGMMWAIDGQFKFWPGFIQAFPGMVAAAAQGQPAFLSGWFSFWVASASANPALIVYLSGLAELALAFSLIAGFMRKLSYGVGFVFSLMIWMVPEGFGGPYGVGSTDIGTGIIYATVFLFLAILNATHGGEPYTLDAKLEGRIKWWKLLAEIKY